MFCFPVTLFIIIICSFQWILTVRVMQVLWVGWWCVRWWLGGGWVVVLDVVLDGGL